MSYILQSHKAFVLGDMIFITCCC